MVKDKIAFVLLCIYAFTVPLGMVFRFTSEEGSLGISTIVLLLLVMINILQITPLFFRVKIFFVLLLLVLWFSFSTLLTTHSIEYGYKMLISLILYILLAMAITQVDLTAKRLGIFFIWLTAGIFLSSGLTLIDFLGIVDVPGANESRKITRIAGGYVIQASGFFPRRSAMAAYFSLVLPAWIPLFIHFRNAKLKIILSTAYIVSLMIMFLTHNLAGIFGILLASGLYLLWGSQINISKRMKKIIIAGVLFISFWSILMSYFPNVMQVYRFRFGTPSDFGGIYTDSFALQKESDNLRLYLLLQGLGHLAKNPFGHGYTLMWTNKYGLMDPHNIITQVIWGAGLFSFVWLGMFGHLVVKLVRIKFSPRNDLLVYFDALKYGLLAWFITGMAHTIICTGLAWIFFGMILNIRSKSLGMADLEMTSVKQQTFPVAS